MRRDVGISLALMALVFLAFGPALGADFVAWDDDMNFLHNQDYRGLALHNLGWMFTTFHLGPYQPLAWLTLGLDYSVYGMDARGYHVTSVLIHAGTTVAFFFMARRLFACARTSWGQPAGDIGAFFAALVFGVHPLRVESVAWITERRDVVSGFFFVATVIAWLGFVTSADRRRSRYATALLLFVMALLSKASVVTLPFALLVLDVWPLQRWRSNLTRVLVEKIPFFALSVLFAILAVVGQSSTGTALRALEHHGVVRRLAQSSYAAVFYPWKTLVPSGLSPIYDMPSPFDPLAPRFLVAAGVFLLVSAGAWALRRRSPAVAVAWITLLILLAPVSGLVSSGPQLVADRYSYLACMPLALLAASGVGLSIGRGMPRVVLIGAATVCVALGLSTWRQSEYWRTSVALWERAFAIDPRSAVACDHLGVVRVAQSQAPNLSTTERMRLLDEAIALYAQAFESAPHPNHLFNIGGALMEYAPLDPSKRTEELELAADAMRKGLDFASQTTGIQPRWRGMYAAVLVELGRRDAAREELALVLRETPKDVGALQWSARIEIEEGRLEEGLALLRRTTTIEPENARVWSVLGNTCAKFGRPDEARAALETAARLGGARGLFGASAPSTPSAPGTSGAH